MVKRHHQSQPATWQVITFGRIQTLTTELNNRNARDAVLSRRRDAAAPKLTSAPARGRLLGQPARILRYARLGGAATGMRQKSTLADVDDGWLITHQGLSRIGHGWLDVAESRAYARWQPT
jgi:hypothetical protein